MIFTTEEGDKIFTEPTPAMIKDAAENLFSNHWEAYVREHGYAWLMLTDPGDVTYKRCLRELEYAHRMVVEDKPLPLMVVGAVMWDGDGKIPGKAGKLLIMLSDAVKRINDG